MTVLEMQSGCRIGQEYLIAPGHEKGLKIRVVVRGLREVWGSMQAHVEPVAGDGLCWVMAGRLLPVQGQQSCGLPLGHAAQTVECAWCKCHISGPLVSHRICKPCADGMRAPKFSGADDGITGGGGIAGSGGALK